MEAGVDVEVHHHEVGNRGVKVRLIFVFGTLTDIGDKLALYKYIIKNMAACEQLGRYLYAETALPRQRFRDARPPEPVERWKGISSTIHRDIHFSVRMRSITLVACSRMPARSVAIIAPTTNSLQTVWSQGMKPPVNIAYSQRNRSACVPYSCLLQE